jgi:hypothetical protein
MSKKKPLKEPELGKLRAGLHGDTGRHGVTGLALRVLAGGRRVWVYRFTRPNGGRSMPQIGVWGDGERMATDGMDLEAARDAVRELAKRRRHAPNVDLVAERRGERRPAAASPVKAGTLGALLDRYVAHLRARKSPSANDAANIFANHIPEEGKALPADQVTPAHVTGWMREAMARIAKERGRPGRTTAAKLRAYLRSAYTTTLRAHYDARLPAAEAALAAIEHNPVAVVATWSAGAKSRVLEDDELRAFLAEVRRIPEHAVSNITQRAGRKPVDFKYRLEAAQQRAEALRDAILLALLAGGQRIRQLLAVKVSDVADDSFALLDAKGRGRATTPRRHVVPIVGDEMRQIIERRVAAAGSDDRVFSFTPVRRPLDQFEFSAAVKTISDRLVAGKYVRQSFDASDLRRTCETTLSRLGVSQDVRAQLLSHGIAGVQAKHYDRHSYMQEKRDALAKLHDHLTAIELLPAPGPISDVFTAQEHQKRADHTKKRLNAGRRVSKLDIERVSA